MVSSKNKNIQPKVDKSLIFIKSTVVALGLVFLVLLALLIILKFNKNKQQKLQDNCKTENNLEIKGEVNQIIDNGSDVILLTKPQNNQQEILILNKSCGLTKQRFYLNIKNQ